MGSQFEPESTISVGPFRPTRSGDWEPFKDAITKLYWDDEMTLSNVMQTMETTYGFYATKKQYRTRLQAWGLDKNLSSADMSVISQIQQTRREVEDKDTEFTFRGKIIPQRKIDRWRRRQKACHDDHATASTPTGIGYGTPRFSESQAPTPDLTHDDRVKPKGEFTARGDAQMLCGVPSAFTDLDNFVTDPGASNIHTNISHPLFQIDAGELQYPNHGPPTGHQCLNFPHVRLDQVETEDAPTMQMYPRPIQLSPAVETSPRAVKRKALLIGINYIGQRGELKGCISDVNNMSMFLIEHFGFTRDNMVILSDDRKRPTGQPTRQNIVKAMQWLVKDARPNDSLFFHFSGHSGRRVCLNESGLEGFDEVIYPVDFDNVGDITDSEMHNIMIKSLQPGVRLTAIIDSKHEFPALDLPYSYAVQGILKEPNLLAESGTDLLQGLAAQYSGCNPESVASSLLGFFKSVTAPSSMALKRDQTVGEVIMFRVASCHNQINDDGDMVRGHESISHAFIATLRSHPKLLVSQLMNRMNDEILGGLTLACSRPLDITRSFEM